MLCVFPIVIADIVEMASNGKVLLPLEFIKAAIILVYMNPMVNFFIYAAMSNEYRRAYKRLMCKTQIASIDGSPDMRRRSTAVSFSETTTFSQS